MAGFWRSPTMNNLAVFIVLAVFGACVVGIIELLQWVLL
jgi:hypothetical protein